MNIDTLTGHLVASGRLQAETSAGMRRTLDEEAKGEPSPWYFQALTALGAWVAAIFFFGFVAAAFGSAFDKSPVAVGILGIILIATATVARRQVSGFFLEQICLAVSMTGHVLVLTGIGLKWSAMANMSHSLSVMALAAILLAIVDYPLYRDFCHRLLSSLTALFFTTAAIYDLTDHPWDASKTDNPLFDGLIAASMAMHLLILSFVFLRRSGIVWRPLGYAAAISLVAMQFTYRLGLFGGPWTNEATLFCRGLFLVGLLRLGWVLLGEGHPFRRNGWQAGILGFFAVALGLMAPPPILLSLFLILLGYAKQDRFFEWGGLLLLGYSLIVYYYSLAGNLASKSSALCASGALLLLALVTLKKTVWKKA